MIYLDNNATTQMAPEVKSAMDPFLGDRFANPSSLHQPGAEMRKALELAREKVARLLGARHPREIVFTSGATESNNAALRSALKCVPERKKIVTTEVEHTSILSLCDVLEREGYVVERVGVSSEGTIDLDGLDRALTNDVALVSVMWTNNETGVLTQMNEVARRVHEKDILFHTDAVQAIGKVPVNVKEHPIDFLSLSAHKFHGPKGIGVLFIRDGVSYSPLIVGGRQERDRRAGTENVPGIIGLAKALELAVKSLSGIERVARLRNQLESGLIREMRGSFINGASSPRIPNTTNITFLDVEAEALLVRLNEMGIAASSGSACLTGAVEPSHVLLAMGRSREEAMSSVRFSLSRETTQSEVNNSLELIPRLIKQLRQLEAVNEGVQDS
jgi:cysteine desulfurase